MTLFSALRALPDMEVVGLNFSSATTPELLLKTFDHYCEYRKTPNGVVLAPIQVCIIVLLESLSYTVYIVCSLGSGLYYFVMKSIFLIWINTELKELFHSCDNFSNIKDSIGPQVNI